MHNIIEIAKSISEQSGQAVIIINNEEIWVAHESDIDLYNPSNFNFFNVFKGKQISQKYIEGDNFQEITHILDKTKQYVIKLPHTFRNFQIISFKS